MFSCWLREARYNDCETKADFREFSGQEIIYDSLHEQFVSKVKSTCILKGSLSDFYTEGFDHGGIYNR